MTDLFVDPREEFLTTPQFIRAEEQMYDQILMADRSTMKKAAAAMTAGFLFYRWFLRRRLTQEVAKEGHSLKGLKLAWRAVNGESLTILRSLILPSLIKGYVMGIDEVIFKRVPENVLYDVADGYARSLSTHINDVTREAVMEGFQRQVNRRVPPARAMENVMTAVGVPPRAMNSLVNVWLTSPTDNLTPSVTVDARTKRAEFIIRSETRKRGELIGENEMWTAKTQAKQIVWMYAVENGQLPKDTKRMWVTAADERVCPTCGPLHGVTVPLTQRFEIKGEKAWSPPLHVNCRCDIKLTYKKAGLELVLKAYGQDKYDRDPKGRFAPMEQRGAKLRLKTKTESPEIADIRSQMQAYELQDILSGVQTKKELDQRIERAKLSGRANLGTAKLGQAKLGRANLSDSKPALEREKAALQREKAVIGTAGLAKLSRDVAKLDSAVKAKIAESEKAKPRSNPWMPLENTVGMLLREYTPADYKGTIEYTTTGGDVMYPLPDPDFRIPFPPHLADSASWNNPLIQQVKEYWDGWIDEQVSIFTEENSKYPRVIHFGPDNRWQVPLDEDMFTQAILDVVYQIPEDQRDDIPVSAINSMTGETEKTYLSTTRIIQFLGLSVEVYKATPVLALFGYGRPGDADIRPSGETINPGRWQSVSWAREEDLLSAYQDVYAFKAVYFEPVDLYEE